MKHNAPLTLLLALAGAVGSIRCLTSCFSLAISPGVVLSWAVTAGVCTLVLPRRRGLVWLLGAAALLWLLHTQDVSGAFVHLGSILANALSLAYGLAFRLPESSGNVQLALGIWGGVIVFLICCTLYRRWRCAGAVLLLALGPVFCLVARDSIPDKGAVFSLLAVILLLLLTDFVRRESGHQAVRLLLTAALPVMLFLGAVFLLFSEEGYVNPADTIRQALSLTLKTAQALPAVSLEGLTGPPEGDRAVMTVTSSQTGTLYLRIRDFADYDGRDWANRQRRQELYSGTGPILEEITISTRQPLDTLLVPHCPEAGTLLTQGQLDNAEKLTDYTCCRYAPAQTPPPEDCFLALPEETRRGAAPIAAKLHDAQAIGAYVRGSAVYDLHPQAMPEDAPDFALWFLNQADRGYCIHFATAAAVLLRAAGIPARLVTGYLVQTQAGQAVTVTEAQAHAWTEYYADSHWQILEATPAAQAPVPASEDFPLPRLPLLPFLLLIPLQRWIRLLLRFLRRHRGSPNRRALALWQEARRLAACQKTEIPQNLTDIALKARYSQHTVTPQELAAFTAYRRACRKTKRPLYTWLWARYVHCI